MVGGRPVGRGQNLSHTDVGDLGEGLGWTGRLRGNSWNQMLAMTCACSCGCVLRVARVECSLPISTVQHSVHGVWLTMAPLCCSAARQVGSMRHVIGTTADKRRSHPRPSSSSTPSHTHRRRHRHAHAYTHAYASYSPNDRRGLNEKADTFLRSSVNKGTSSRCPACPRSAGVWQLADDGCFD